jgi:hypothetical protein
MSYAAIQAAINQGNAIAGSILGTAFSQYRPAGGVAINSATLVGSVTASFAAKGNFTRPGSVKDPEFIGYFDITDTLPGDYLVGSSTYFIASQEPLLPTLCVLCNGTVTLSRVPAGSSSGLQTEQSQTPAAATTVFTAWPASILQGTKGERGDVNLPDDTRTPWWAIRLPATPGILIRTDDYLTDANGIAYSVSSAELTRYGWRLTARQNET